MEHRYDAIVVGAGPNGLAAGITLARAGATVLLLEAAEQIGGSARTEALTLPGFLHDACSSIHPLAVASPFFRGLELDIEWKFPPVDVAHPLEGERAAFLKRSIDASAESLGPDARTYTRLMEPFAKKWEPLIDEVLQPMLHVPRSPFLMARFGWQALKSAAGLAQRRFVGEEARALFAGLAGHSFLPLESAASAAIGLVLGILAHGAGWPMPRGGSGKIMDAMAAVFRSFGGVIETNHPVKNIEDLPPSRVVLFDVSPRQLLEIAGRRLPSRYCAALRRYRYGPGVFKVDYALSAPIPWTASACRHAGTVHVGGKMGEISASESEVSQGALPERPFVLVAQHSLFDASRAPAGKHTAWAYCHVPNGSTADMTERIERQIERFAPGFRDCILMRATRNCRELERRNANLIGGDINGGRADLRQLLARPVPGLNPYRTPAKGIYLCSASTPPGGGVHGMCGYNAARVVLRDWGMSPAR